MAAIIVAPERTNLLGSPVSGDSDRYLARRIKRHLGSVAPDRCGEKGHPPRIDDAFRRHPRRRLGLELTARVAADEATSRAARPPRAAACRVSRLRLQELDIWIAGPERTGNAGSRAVGDGIGHDAD